MKQFKHYNINVIKIVNWLKKKWELYRKNNKIKYIILLIRTLRKTRLYYNIMLSLRLIIFRQKSLPFNGLSFTKLEK